MNGSAVPQGGKMASFWYSNFYTQSKNNYFLGKPDSNANTAYAVAGIGNH
jgi:hypothetical protein